MEEETRSIEEILEMLDESIKSGLYFEIRAEDSATLKEYIEAQNKQIGIANTVNQMKQNNIVVLTGNLEKAYREINSLTAKVTNMNVTQLEERERTLELEIQTKLNKLTAIERTIKTISQELEDLEDNYLI